jgi:hypothetical protein
VLDIDARRSFDLLNPYWLIGLATYGAADLDEKVMRRDVFFQWLERIYLWRTALERRHAQTGPLEGWLLLPVFNMLQWQKGFD